MDEIKVTLFDRWTWIRDWVKENKTQAIILGLILLIGAFFRLYRVSEYMTFLGDEGRDVIVVRRLLVDFDPILVGPGTSIGNMYLGPLYYYMMAPALFLASFSPAGPAIMIALLGIITVGFIWWVGKEWFSTNAGLIAAGLYAISPVVITYSRSSWNPNIMPFFALLAVYAIDQVWRHHRFNWLLVASISFAFILQSHYLGFLIAPVLGIFWFITLLTLILRKKIIKQKEKKVALRRDTKSFVRLTFVSIGIVTILMSPLVVFDARHGWRNFISMKKFFLNGKLRFPLGLGQPCLNYLK